MFSDKPAVLELAALLKAHGINRIVLSPGSRNVPIVRTLASDPFFDCHAVTDERSAAFYAMGLAMEDGRPAVVCCTSGTALLNFHSAVAESFYQQIPLIVISADRLEAWVGQMDGQTLPQAHVFGSLVKASFAIPNVQNAEDRWQANRQINEAILKAAAAPCGPVHLNIPISEPFFATPVTELPEVRVIRRAASVNDFLADKTLVNTLLTARRRWVVAGQRLPGKALSERAVALYVGFAEHLANRVLPGAFNRLDPLFMSLTDEERAERAPDLVITFGGHVVSKQLKRYLRQVRPTNHWHVSPDGAVADVFQCQTLAIAADPLDFLEKVADLFPAASDAADERTYWRAYTDRLPAPDFAYSEMKALGQLMENLPKDSVLHLGNSSVVRYAEHFPVPEGVPCYCNRGTSGIDGSLSTAVGYAAVNGKLNFIPIGDLSFFYDMNALWSVEGNAGIRILLLNNAGGEIFHALPGMQVGDGPGRFITADHDASAAAWAKSRGFDYLAATNDRETEEALRIFTKPEADRPMLLEVFTDKTRDIEILRGWLDRVKKAAH